ncbi:glycyl aminopeptidase [Halorhabdus amylolytica]|uniref:glycyl aminopeptidase n=1 Tax=Halorhabdus amylolytica TaxID=2559573 RepID=UPI0010A9AB6D|nr:glycyl aminopeptidase [Halorhabdus amylolytica]
MTARWIIAGLIALLLSAPLAGVAAATGDRSPASTGIEVPAAQTGGDGNITVTQHVRLTPGQPGEVAVTMAVSLPDRVESFAVDMATRATVTGTDGFDQDGGQYRWTGATDPTITYTLRANETVTGEGPEPVSGTYLFADAGSWALVRPPRMSTSWKWFGERVGVDWNLDVPGEGATGGTMAFLGPHRTYTQSAHGQTFAVVVPRAAEMDADPQGVLDAFATASEDLRMGDRDERVFTVVAPTSVDWAVRGLQTGDSDMYVLANERLDAPDNAWLHEYVHTRQRLDRTASTKWLTEASASYYASLLAMEGDLIGFDAFRHKLARGADARYDDVVLADESTWVRRAEYEKGALVVGEIDRRIRLATDGAKSFETVLAALNRADQFDHRRLLALVERAGNRSVRAATDRYVRTDAGPEMWSRADHAAAFDGSPAHITTRVAEDATYRIEGSDRNESVKTIPTLTAGERLIVPVRVTNDGGADGDYEVALTVDGTVVERATGTLGAGETITVELGHGFGEAGTYRLSVAGKTVDVTVTAAIESTRTATEQERTDEPTDRGTETPAPSTETATTGTSGPGFTALVALFAIAIVACRKR